MSHEQATRTQKAEAALRSGGYSISAVGLGRWNVISLDGDAYIVSRDRDRWSCTCPDHAELATSAVRCKHAEIVRLSQHEVNMLDQNDWLRRLTAPFYPDDVQWRVGVKPKKAAEEPKALMLPYVDARTVMNRLDDVVGPLNWQVVHAEVNGQMVTSIGIRNPETGDWVWKGDSGYVGGGDSEDDDVVEKSVKGTPSDGLKRAAVQWGIGRYLYDLPKIWLAWEWTDSPTNTRGKVKGHPTLPPWALPTNASKSGFEHNIYLGPDRETVLDKKDATVQTAVTPAKRGTEPLKASVADQATGEVPMSPGEKALAEAKAVVMRATFKGYEHLCGKTMGELTQTVEGRNLIAAVARLDAKNETGKQIKAAALLLNVPEGMR